METVEMENGKGQNLIQMNVSIKSLINDHLLKTTSLQRPHTVAIRFQKWLTHTYNNNPLKTPLYKDQIVIRFQRWPYLTLLQDNFCTRPPLCKDHINL